MTPVYVESKFRFDNVKLLKRSRRDSRVTVYIAKWDVTG